jgi:dTDP-glucose 4,6-dehydratase
VTGAGGFLGSHVAEALLAEGAHVRALVRRNSRGTLGHLAALQARAGLEPFHGDVRDADQVARAVRGCAAVFHLAALVGEAESVEAPRSFLDVNVLGTMHVLEGARAAGGPLVVHASAFEVLGPPRGAPLDETHPAHARSPFAASKIAADRLVEAYAASYGLPTVVLRPFSVYGPRQAPGALVPRVIAQALRGGRIRPSRPAPVRDMVFATDAAAAFVAAARRDEARGRTFHVGSGVGVATPDLVRRILVRLGRPQLEVSDDVAPRVEGDRFVCDASRARQVLDWSPRIDLDTGIARTSAFVRAHLDAYPEVDGDDRETLPREA